jgi:hypothetical protein
VRHRALVVLSLTFWLVGRADRASCQAPPPAAASSVTVTVDAKHPWVDSGLVVRTGERLSFQADGTIRWGAQPDHVAGPEGHGAKPGKVGAGGLIGRVGYTSKPFPVGNTRTPITMPRSGELFLGINDFVFKDNSGSFVVTITRPPAP